MSKHATIFETEPATTKQVAALVAFCKMTEEAAKKMTKSQAFAHINACRQKHFVSKNSIARAARKKTRYTKYAERK